MNERPTCKGCGVKLRPSMHAVYEKIETPRTLEEITRLEAGRTQYSPPIPAVRVTHRKLGKVFHDWQGYDGFHTLSCALRFAVAAYDAGYRRGGAP